MNKYKQDKETFGEPNTKETVTYGVVTALAIGVPAVIMLIVYIFL